MKRSSPLLCLLLVLALAAGPAACGREDATSSAEPTASASFDAASSSDADSSSEESGGSAVPDVSDVRWEAVGMLNASMRAAGVGAGEGCQWTLSVCYAYSEPEVCFFGTDVGGIYRSTDGGTSWAPCTRGIVTAGGQGIAVDPKNSSRVLVVGSNGGPVHDKECGLYLSTDKGDSFHQVLSERITGWRDNRVQIVYDPTSFDSGKGYCTTVYWSKETMKYAPSPYGVTNGGNTLSMLYKSTDGGETWSLVSSAASISGAQLAVEPGSGAVLAANAGGLWRSVDGGKTFSCVMEGLTTSVTTCLTKPGFVWATRTDGLYRSADGGATFSRISASGYPAAKLYPSQVAVSAADPDYVWIATDQQTWNYATGASTRFSGECDYYYSHDGGVTFTKGTIDRTNSFFQQVNHQAQIALHPTDKNRLLALGGDIIIRSTDGGVTFRQVGAGYNGGCWTSVSVNVNDPNLIALSNQDYIGAYTVDGGATWISLQRGGNKLTEYTYGCYPVSESVLLYVARDDSNRFKMGAGKYVVMRSTDGGKSFMPTNLALNGQATMLGVVGDRNVVFADGYRSADGGATWKAMDGCERVYAAAKDGAVYGMKGRAVVRSTDGGLKWETVCTLTPDGDPVDLSYSETDGSIWVLIGSGVVWHIVDGVAKPIAPFDHCGTAVGSVDGRSIACDPEKNVVYIGAYFRTETEKGGILRSADGGKTWALITPTTKNAVQNEGPYRCSELIVHPVTRDLYVIGDCRGLWKTAAPKN